MGIQKEIFPSPSISIKAHGQVFFSSRLVFRAHRRLPHILNFLRHEHRLVFLWMAILFAILLGVASGQTFDRQSADPEYPKINFRLLDLLKLDATPAPRKEGLVRIDEEGRVQVYIRAKPAPQELIEHIQTLGGKIDGQGLGVIQAWVPIYTLEELAALPEVLYIFPPDYGHSNVGSVTSQGDAILKAGNARQQFNVSGQGIRIGVLSDGLKGLEQSIASGDLPSTTFHCRAQTVTLRSNGCLPGETLVETTGGVTGKSFRSDKNLTAGAEGTAMLEIIHDLAPGAELWFAGGFGTTMDLANAAVFLTANVDVVVSDINHSGSFPDGKSTLSQTLTETINNPDNRSRAFFQAVGNVSNQHYSGAYTDSGNDHFHLFSANSETTGPRTPDVLNRIFLPSAGSVVVALTWNDPALASSNNYDLRLVDCLSGTLLAASTTVQNGVQDPLENLSYTNESSDPVEVCYGIQKAPQAAPRMLNVVIHASPGLLGHMFNTPGHSLTAPADAFGSLISVGAVHVSSPNYVGSESSRGPTFDGRVKPDMVATDGVTVTGAGGFSSLFFGTSASAPHAAAITALLLEAHPTLTFDQIYHALTSTAVDLEAAGPDPVAGYGRIDALAAVNALVGMQRTLTVTKGGTGSGTVTSAPGGISCGGDCTESYAEGSTLVLTAVAGTGSTFAGWSGGMCSGTATCSVGMTAPRTVTATFTLALQNQAPSVNAGPAQTIILPNSATLDGTVTDEGQPNPPGLVTSVWSKVSGPGTVTFGNPNAVDTTADFSRAGIFVLRLTASDGALSNSSDLIITVQSQELTGQPRADVNGDGKADIVWRKSDGGVAIWFMNGTNIASSGFPAGVPVVWQIAGIGDVNGDGKADLIWRHSNSGAVAVWLMDGSTITSVGFPGSASKAWKIQAVGDVNGDGKADLIWRHGSGATAIWFMNGTSLASSGFPAGVPVVWQIAGVGDVNKDGKADIIWRHSNSGTVALWLMDGLRITAVGFPGSASKEWVIEGIGDVDGNGRADIVWHNTSNGRTAIWEIHGTAIAFSGFPGVMSAEWKIEQIGDMDGDGKADIVWRNFSPGAVEVWIMNGLSITTTGSPGSASTDWEIQ